MKNKQIVALVAVAVVLGLAAYFSGRQREKRLAPADLVGRLLLPDLPVNDVEKIAFISASSTVSVAKSEGRWIVPDRFGYPADFTKVVETIRAFADLKIGQVLNVSDSQLAGLKLLDPEKAGEGRTESAGTRIELRGKNDVLLASFLAGAEFMRKRTGPPSPYMDPEGYPDGRYIRTSDGKVVTVSSTLSRFMRESKNWLKEDSLNVAASNIVRFCLSGGKNKEQIEFRRPAADKQFETSNITPAEDEEFDKNKINRSAGALRYLGFDDVADPALSDEQIGMNEPAVFTAHADDGKFYTVTIGAKVAADKDDRYGRIRVEWKEPDWDWAFAEQEKEETKEQEKSDAPADEQNKDASGEKDGDKADARKKAIEKSKTEAAEQDAIFKNWTYILRSYRIEPMLFGRDDFIKKKEKPKDEKKEEGKETAEKKEEPTVAQPEQKPEKPAAADKSASESGAAAAPPTAAQAPASGEKQGEQAGESKAGQ